MDIKAQQAYELYKQNINISQIATNIGVTRQTISNWRKKYKWDQLLLSEHSINSYEKEQQFILELIKQWDKAVDELNNSDLKNKLTILEKYTKLYYKLKNINETKSLTTKLKKQNIIKTLIYAISDIALKQKNIAVVNFLEKNLNTIVECADD